MLYEDYIRIYSEIAEPEAKPLWVQDFHSIITHTRGVFSEKIIGTRRPNEEEATQKYRVANWRPVTKNAFMEAITNLQRILSHSNVEIVYPAELRPYISDNVFENSDLVSYFQRKVVKYMCEAANALLVWWPENVGDTTQQMTVRPIVVFPDRIKQYKPGEYLSFLSDEKSEVRVGKGTETTGEIYYVITSDVIAKRVQVGYKNKNTFEWQPYATNVIGEVYALPLGGDETTRYERTRYGDNKEIRYYTSYLNPALAFADECLCQFSDHQGTMVNCSHPLREVERIKCSNEGCNKGKIHTPEGLRNCGVCDGTGNLPLTSSPYGVLIRPSHQGIAGEKSTTDIPVMRFIHPETAILEFGNKSWREYLKDTEDSLKLLFTDEAQSGIAKTIDREDKLAWLDKIAVNLYKYLLTESIQIIHKFRFPNQDIPAVYVNLPFTFTVKRDEDYIDTLKQLREQNAPEMLILETMREYITKKFNGDPARIKKFDVLAMLDPLMIKTGAEKAQMFASGLITQDQVLFSNYAPLVLDQYARETQDFVDIDIDTVANAVAPRINQRVATFRQIQ